MLKSKLLMELAGAIKDGNLSFSEQLLSKAESALSTENEINLFNHLKARFSSKFNQDKRVEAVNSIAQPTCGVHNFYPDLTGRRIIEGGRRLSNVLKNNDFACPLVTVITVVLNNEKKIETCIESVLNQTYPNIEYIIIDGCSTDATVEIILKYQDRVDYFISEPDHGIYNAMNKGLKLARGEYIAFLNADDRYFTYAVEHSIQNIVDNRLDISYAGFYYADVDSVAILADEARPWNESMLIQGIPGGHETFFVHKNCYNSIGGYNESYRLAADYQWVIRAFKYGFKSKPLKSTLLVMATGGASFNAKLELDENYAILRECFGKLPLAELEFLYSLKFYKNWFEFNRSDEELLDRLAHAGEISAEFGKALTLTIDYRKLGCRGTITPAEEREGGKLKIAVVVTYLAGAAGGAERIAIEAANSLAGEGHAVTIVSCCGTAIEPFYRISRVVPHIDLAIHPYKTEYAALGSETVVPFDRWAGRCFPELNFTPIQADFDRWAASPHAWRTRVFSGFFRKNKFDVVISHMPSSYPYVLLGKAAEDEAIHIAALHNAPSIKFYSDLYPAEDKMVRYMRLVALENATHISLLFESFRRQMPALLQQKCFVLPNFASEQVRVPIGTTSISNKNNIISVGRLAAQKDHATLIKAFANIRHLHPDWTLKIYGDGPMRSELGQLCESLDLDPHNVLQGAVTNIGVAYAEAGIFAFPSLFEGFGLAAVEAMNFDLPVVAFADCEGVNELIEHDVDGILVKPIDRVEALGEVLSNLIQNPDFRQRLGQAGRAKAAQFTIKQHLEALRGIIDASKFQSAHGQQRRFAGQPPLKVAIVTTYLEGGAGIAAQRLKEALLRQNLDARTVSFSKGSAPADYKVRLGAAAQQKYASFLSLDSSINKRNGASLFSASYPSLDFGHLDFLREFDIINLHWVQTLLSNEAIAYVVSFGKPVVWTLHDMNPFTGGCHYSDSCQGYEDSCAHCPQMIGDFKYYPENILGAKKIYWPEDWTIVAPSRWLSGCARRSAVFAKNRILSIANSVDTDVFCPTGKREARDYFGLPHNKKILLFTCQSHAEKRKGFASLVTLSELLAGQNFHVLTFGNSSSELGALKLPYTAVGHLADESKLALGYVAADVTVLPTFDDNLPNIILESAACGTPIVAFDAGGVGDAVINDVTGFLVPLGNCMALAHAVHVACERNAFAKSCRDHALSYFAYRCQAEKYIELFDDLKKSDCSIQKRIKNEIFPEMKSAHKMLAV